MVYMLFDNPTDKQNMAFLNGFETVEIRQIYPSKKCDSIRKLIVTCNKCIKQTTEKDTIICWYDFMGVLCWWICRIQRKKRRIVILNILLKDKATVKNKVAKVLYRAPLKAINVQATVTAEKYGAHLNQMLGIHKKYILLHDIYHESYKIDYNGQIIPNSVFCGGRNGRNWDFLFRIACEMPTIVFRCVMPKELFDQHKSAIPDNVTVWSDIPEKEFLKLMCESQLVVMPLDTEAPAGLIVFYQAAANEKMVITSDTVVMREYFAQERGVLCKDAIEDWKNKIEYYLQTEEKAKKSARAFRLFLEQECSEERYAETLWKMISK